MRLIDLITEASNTDDESKDKPGTYAGARLSKKTKQAIEDYFKTNNVKNSQSSDDMHATLLYSRKHLPNYKAPGTYDKPLIGKSAGFEIWPGQGDNSHKNYLILTLDSPDLTKRHKQLMKEHDAEYDFDEYKPHVTFSYDFGDRDPKTLDPIDFDIEFSVEYHEELDGK